MNRKTKGKKKPQFKDFNLSEEEYSRLRLRLKRINRFLHHTAPVITGSILGIIIYLIYYKPFSKTDPLQIILSFFVFGGFGVLFFGLPLMFFKSLNHIYIKYLKKNSADYNNSLKYDIAVDGYKRWEMRTRVDFWQTLDTNSLRNELITLFRNFGYVDLSRMADDYVEYDLVLNKKFVSIPLICRAQTKKVGIDFIRKWYKREQKLKVTNMIFVSSSGFTSAVKKFIVSKNIFLITADDLVEAHIKGKLPVYTSKMKLLKKKNLDNL